MYKNIIFDLGGVMVDFDPKTYLVDRFCNAEVEEQVSQLTFESEEWKLLDAGLITRSEANLRMLARAKEYGRAFEVQGVLDDWMHILRPRRRMQELVRKLKSRGYCVYYLSNIPEDVLDFLTERDLKGLFGGGVPTVMAHCIYSPDDEAALMKQNRVMIAHCPTSNENVIAGIAPAAHYLRGGWRVGLGSDVAGGQTLDLFTVMATAVQVSKLRWRYIDQSEKPLTMVEALYMATVGGGDFWADFGEKVGLFEDGYAFDALVLDDDPLKNMRAFSAAERLERYAYLGKGKLTAKFAAGEKLL